MKSLLAFQMGWCLAAAIRLSEEGNPVALFPFSILLLSLAAWLLVDKKEAS
jgi:hypothetical protein